MQTELEGISEQLRIPGSKALGPVSKVRCLASLLFRTSRFGPLLSLSFQVALALVRNGPQEIVYYYVLRWATLVSHSNVRSQKQPECVLRCGTVALCCQ